MPRVKYDGFTSERRKPYEERGWYFSQKDGRFIAFIAGKKNDSIVSCSTVQNLFKRINEYEEKIGATVYTIVFDNVPEHAELRIKACIESNSDSNTKMIGFESKLSIEGGTGFRTLSFKYSQVANDYKSIIDSLDVTEFLRMIDFSKSRLV